MDAQLYIPTGRPRGRPRKNEAVEERVHRLAQNRSRAMKAWAARRTVIRNASKLRRYIAANGIISQAQSEIGTERERLASWFICGTNLGRILAMLHRHGVFVAARELGIDSPAVPLTLRLINRDEEQALLQRPADLRYALVRRAISVLTTVDNVVHLRMNSVGVPAIVEFKSVWVADDGRLLTMECS